jgi:hypothetical protein
MAKFLLCSISLASFIELCGGHFMENGTCLNFFGFYQLFVIK